MTTVSALDRQPNLLDHPALTSLSEQAQQRLLQQASPVSLEIGELLCSRRHIPSEVVWIKRGQARSMVPGHGHGVWDTVAKLGPGSLVGLSSLLRCTPSEEVAASSRIEGLSIQDQLILELLLSEPSLMAWCCQKPPVEEIGDLLHHLLPLLNTPIPLPRAIEVLGDQMHLVSFAAAKEGQQRNVLVASSGNLIGIQPGKLLQSIDGWPDVRPPLPPRVISLPADWPEQLIQACGILTSDQKAPDTQETPSSLRLEPTTLDLGQSEPRPQLRLLRAEGALAETLACFRMLASDLKLPYRKDAIEKILRDAMRRGQSIDLQLLGNLGSLMGLHVSAMRVPAELGTRLQVPALLLWQQGPALLRASDAAGVVIASPRDGWLELSPKEVLESFSDGIELLLLERSNTTPEQRFGFGWFWPALQRYRGVLLQVLMASFVVQLLGLANPLLIQVIIDKVISQRSLDTLQVLGFALVVVTLLEGVLGSLRTFLFTETTNRIDLRLGAEVIDHLLRLPAGYFDKRPVGELGSRIAELEKIRTFLTGQALTSALDAAFSLIYIVVMLIYSWLLSLIALVVVPIQVLLTVVGAPLFRRQYRQTAEENARTQSHLVEVLTGIQTVKAQNVEMVSRWKWQDLYSKYISRSFEKTITATALSETSQTLQKLSQLLVLWIGAALVLKGDMSLGQLIAFRIISGYVTQPLLRLSSLWQSFQELKVSFERLADVIDTPEESNEADKAKIPLPPLAGSVVFENICFCFRPNSPQVLNHVNLAIPKGTFVGVVGQSGSGKSTLTKMLSRLYIPTDGRILIDGTDIDKVELYSLRRQIGIVPQEPLLFSGSVADNIALTDPNVSSDAIVQAAQLACAHDFIMELPGGYSTDVGERGANLSGGQRQRLALARTLLSQPRLLVLDEATSALDYATERRVCDNLLESLSHTTVFFITHRLSTVRRADLIVMMDQGQVVETGTHDELIQQRGRYFALYRQQEAS